MKLFIYLFIVSTQVMGATFSDRLSSLKDIRTAAIKCGINQPNMALFKKKLSKDIDEMKLACLESKSNEINAEKAILVGKLNKIKQSRAFIRAYNCSLITKEIERAICFLIKGRL